MRRILIVKIAAIGDVIMATSLLTHLREHEKNAHITWVCGTTSAPLLKALGLVDELIEVDEAALFKGSLLDKVKAFYKLWKTLKLRFFDLILTAHSDPRYRLLSLFARTPNHRFFSRKNRSPLPGRDHSQEYLHLLLGTEGPDTPLAKLPAWPLPPTPPRSSPTIALAPGGAKNLLRDDALRRWPVQHYVALAEKLLHSGINVLLTGSPSDTWILPHFAHLPCENLVGQTDLCQLVSLYQTCDLLITHDSGPLHLAKLARCKTLALFGPTNPLERISLTQSERITALCSTAPLSCRPCYDGKNYAPCKNNICMSSISPQRVFQTALQLTQNEGNPLSQLRILQSTSS